MGFSLHKKEKKRKKDKNVEIATIHLFVHLESRDIRKVKSWKKEERYRCRLTSYIDGLLLMQWARLLPGQCLLLELVGPTLLNCDWFRARFGTLHWQLKDYYLLLLLLLYIVDCVSVVNVDFFFFFCK